MKTKHPIVVCAVCMAVSFACLNTGLGAEYTAKAWLIVQSRAPAILARSEKEFSEKEFATYKRTQRLLLKSPFALMAALRKPEVTRLPSVQTQRREGDPIRWLDGLIKVEFPDDAEIMLVSCTRNDPDEAQTLLKSVVDAYMTEIVVAERDSRQQRIIDLEESTISLEKDLVAQKQVLRELTSDLPDDADKAKPKPPSVDVQMIQLNIETLEKMVFEFRMELERQRIELRARSRVMQLGPVEKPLVPD